MNRYSMLQAINFNSATGNNIRTAVFSSFVAPQKRFNSFEYHANAKGLHNVVIGSDRKSDQLIGLFCFGGQHHNRSITSPAFRSQLPTDFNSVYHRNHQVQQNHVRLFTTSLVDSVLSVVGAEDLITCGLEVILKHAR